MSQLFDKIKVASTSRHTFDLSHHQVTTGDFGYLQPICMRHMVPNDDFVVKPDVFVRLAPMALPTYGKISCRIHHFFVPYRILYPKWDAFITQDVNNHTVPPYFTCEGIYNALMLDPSFNKTLLPNDRTLYTRVMSNFGLNPFLFKDDGEIPPTERFNAFPFLAYYRIWLDWFMDANINDHSAYVESFNNIIQNGGDLDQYSAQFLRTRFSCFKKDYLTTAKLNPQDGNPSLVRVDVGSAFNPSLETAQQSNFKLNPNGSVQVASGTTPTSAIGQFTIEALRAANSLQRYLERNNFVGTKIINRILAHFGIAPTPERLDMAEYVGGSDFPIRIADVTSTSADVDPDEPITYGLGVQAGKGVGAGSGDEVRYHAKEHGVFLSLLSILPDTAYYQGISRHWSKGVNGDALDYFHPEFENLGYQEILNHEVYVFDGDPDIQYQTYDYDGIFGYTPRYSEYKFQEDVLGGDFLGVSSGVFGSPDDAFHLFRHFNFDDNDPLALNNNFVELDNHNNNYDRIFQYSNNRYDHFFFNIYCDVKATRPMSGFGEPSLAATNEGDGNTINLPYGGTRL